MFSVNEAKLAEIKSYDGPVVGVRVTPEYVAIRLVGSVSPAYYRAFAKFGYNGGCVFDKNSDSLRIPVISKDLFKRVVFKSFDQSNKNKIVTEEVMAYRNATFDLSCWSDIVAIYDIEEFSRLISLIKRLSRGMVKKSAPAQTKRTTTMTKIHCGGCGKDIHSSNSIFRGNIHFCCEDCAMSEGF